MNHIDANKDTQTKIQAPTPGGNDHVTVNQGGSDTNQINGDNIRHMRGQNQNNRGNKKQLVQQQRSNCTVANESLKLLLSPTDRR